MGWSSDDEDEVGFWAVAVVEEEDDDGVDGCSSDVDDDIDGDEKLF